MALEIKKGMTAAQILEAMRGAGMTADSRVSYTTPSGGRVSMPAVLPAQDSGYSSGPISQAVAPQPVAPVRKGPTFYEPAAAAPSAPGPGFNMSSYLASKLGPSVPRVVSVQPLSGGSNLASTGRGGGDGVLGSILAALTGGFNKANEANEARFSEAKQTLSSFGKSYEKQIADTFKQDVAQQEQQAISRGLGNSSIRGALLSAARRRQQDASLALADRLAAARVNLLQSKHDNAPDPGQMAALVAQASQGAYGSGNTLSSIAQALGLTR